MGVTVAGVAAALPITRTTNILALKRAITRPTPPTTTPPLVRLLLFTFLPARTRSCTHARLCLLPAHQTSYHPYPPTYRKGTDELTSKQTSGHSCQRSHALRRGDPLTLTTAFSSEARPNGFSLATHPSSSNKRTTTYSEELRIRTTAFLPRIAQHTDGQMCRDNKYHTGARSGVQSPLLHSGAQTCT